MKVMDAIAGLLRFDRPIEERALARMCQSLDQHGANSGGMHLEEHLGLAHVPLRPHDQAKADSQPFCNEDQTLWITLCGALYNHAELRALLEQKGHGFRSRSDAEVILHAYEEWGPGCLERINGMFTFGLWDGRKQELFLARDRVGLKPLYYCSAGGEFRFASELPALLQTGTVPRKLNHEALELYFTFLFIPAPFTIYDQVWKVPPASSLLVRQGSQTLQTYWRLNEQEPAGPEDERIEMLFHLLEKAVARQMTSDKPPYVLLSGGLDSGTVLAMACRARSDMEAFSASLEQAGEDLLDARRVASHARARLSEIRIGTVQPELLVDLVRRFGEPYADSSAVPLYLLASETGPDFHTALAGSGGDEVFSGHRRYSRLSMDSGLSLEEKFNSCNQMDEAQKERLFTHRTHPDSVHQLFHQHLCSNRRHDLHSLLKFDFEVRLPGLLLTMNHVVGAAQGIEIRCPLLDQDLVAFATSLPLEVRLGSRDQIELKKLLKDMLRRYELLPAAVIDRTKRGFGAPLHDWLRGDLRSFADNILRSKDALCWQMLRRAHVQERWSRFCQGSEQEAYLFWKIIILEIWLKEFMA